MLLRRYKVCKDDVINVHALVHHSHVSNNRGHSRGPVTLLQWIPVQWCHFSSHLNSLLRSDDPASIPYQASRFISGIFPYSDTELLSHLAMRCKLHHSYKADYRTVSNYLYNLIISSCGERNSCCLGFVSVARVVSLLWKWSTGKAVILLSACWHITWQRCWLVVTGFWWYVFSTCALKSQCKHAQVYACKLLHGISSIWTCRKGHILLT